MAQDPQNTSDESTPLNPTDLHDKTSQQTVSNERGDGTEGLINNGSEQLENASRQGAEMGTAPLHLHSAAKGDEDFINGDDGKQVLPKPQKDKL